MKVPFLLSVSIVALFSNFAQAQSAVNTTPTSEIRFLPKKVAPDKTPGSQYFNETFVPAKIGNSNEIVLVRHNAYTDEIEVNIDNAIKIVPSDISLPVRLTNSPISYEYVEYTTEKGTRKEGYLKAISNNQKIKIYKSESIYRKPEVDPDSGYGTYKPAAYTKLKDEYFIKMGDADIKPLPLKKKSIIAILPEKEKEIAAFIKDNDLSISEEASLVMLGRYINSLM